MKLAEALAEHSYCQNKIEEIKRLLIRSARLQEGDQPAEDAIELLAPGNVRNLPCKMAQLKILMPFKEYRHT